MASLALGFPKSSRHPNVQPAGFLMLDQEGYAFLAAKSEGEAVSSGINLSDRNKHAVFRAVRDLSTSAIARRKGSFTLQSPPAESIASLERHAVARTLKRLVEERLVVQLLRFDHDPDKHSIGVVRVFAARPVEEYDSTRQIYDEINNQSARAVADWLEGAPVTKQTLVRDLESDLKAGREPVDFKGSLLDLRGLVLIKDFEILPESDMIERTLSDVQGRLIENDVLREIPGYGLLKVGALDLAAVFDSASAFLIERVVPRYRKAGSAGTELAQAALEEAVYNLDEFAAPIPDFMAKRARTIRKWAVPGEESTGAERYPGALTVGTIVALEDPVRVVFADAWQKKQNKAFEELEARLLRSGTSWQDWILFLDQERVNAMNPSVWRRLVEHPQLIYGVWEQSGTTTHLLVRRHSKAFRALVEGMADYPEYKHWQALAMRNLLETYEDYFTDLFRDRQFVAVYGRLLRNAYIKYMPWYYRLLLRLRITFIQDAAFQSAKRKITQGQETLRDKNHQRQLALLREKEGDRFRKIRHLKRILNASRLIETLDQFYLREERVPTLEEAAKALPDLVEADFQDLISSERFQVVAGPGGQKLLFYPAVSDVGSRSSKLLEVLAKLEASYMLRPASDTLAQEGLERVRRIRKTATKATHARPTESDSDPYERLEREIERQKKREERALPSDEADLY